MLSDAVGLERISRVIGYKIKKGDFRTSSPNLPQRIAVIGEANTANQSSLDLTPKEITSAQQAGQLYGFGSPLYLALRILKPVIGDGVGGVPVVVYPQGVAGGATAKVLDITPTGTATGNGTHTVRIAGRTGLEGSFYDVNIAEGDLQITIAAKITDAINNILGTPVIAVASATKSTATTKWSGLTAQGVAITVDTNGNSLGITYAVSQVTAGAGTPSVQAALDLFDNDWNTIVVNCYGTVTSVMTALEVFNGIADPTSPTGRYAGIVMKPFIALTGSVAEDPTSITDPKLSQMTIAICPAPLSSGLSFEAAANMAVLYGKCTQNTPHLDINGQAYPDMPTPATIGSMQDYNSRDTFVKKGCSTVDLIGGAYVVQEFITTYHPVGETPPQFRYCRNLMLDFNVRYGYYLLEQLNVVDHVIANDNDVVTAEKVVKPKIWIQVINNYADDLTKRGLIVDAAFMKASISVGIGVSNPDRLETFFRYKRSGVVRIASTTAEAGFNFGTV